MAGRDGHVLGWKSKMRKKTFARRLLVLLVCLAAFYGAAGYLATNEVVGAHPQWGRFIAAPADFGLRAEVVSFHSQDGILLRAWWIPAAGAARGNVVLAHGVQDNRSHMLSRVAFLVRRGYNALAVDLRSHGESAGRYITPGYLEALDVIAAARYLRERGERAPIAVLGFSYGGVAALHAAARSPEIAAVISDSAFASDSEIIDNVRGYYLRSASTPLWTKALLWLSRCPGVYTATALVFYFRTGEYMSPETTTVMPSVERLEKPVLFISGEQDFGCPPEGARRMFAAAPSPQKSLLIVPGAGHTTTFKANPKGYEEAVVAFLEKALS